MIERSEDPVPSDVVASRCSHGGDNAVAIAARSHDRARDQERREIWRASFDYRRNDEPRGTIKEFARYADLCLKEFDERFGATADANLRTQRKHGEG